MRFLSLFPSLILTFLSSRGDPMQDFIQRQYPLAKQGILDNIGSQGAYARDAKPGVVVSSPSTEPVDYKHTFIRDSSLIYKALIDIWADGRDDSLLPGIYDWVSSQGRLQKTPNLTGNLTTGGLGETGFNIDESVYTGPGGRPQHDNPALRSSSMIDFANGLLARNGRTGRHYVESSIWPIVILDLDYVAYHWNVTGFNTWEEASALISAQIRGLKQGADLAKTLGKEEKYHFWNEQADNALCFFQDFWDSTQSVIISNINCDGPCRDTVDVASVFTAIRQFDPEAGCDDATFQPCSEMALRNLKAVVDSMRDIYPINDGKSASEAIAVGRFANDNYVGGHPWFITTFAVAEQLYDAIYQWKRIGKISISSSSLPFFQQLLPNTHTGTFKRGQAEYDSIIESTWSYADDFSLINAKYIPSDGSMSEQYDKVTGEPRSAQRLSASTMSSSDWNEGSEATDRYGPTLDKYLRDGHFDLSEREPPTPEEVAEVLEAIREDLDVSYKDFEKILLMEKSPACVDLYLLLVTPDDEWIGIFPACINLLRTHCNAEGNGTMGRYSTTLMAFCVFE
ncbi:glycoside hydrolase 15 protein [Rhizoctonia solani]